MTHPVAQRLRRELATTLTRLRILDIERDEAPGTPGATTELVDTAQAIEQRDAGQLAAMRLVDRARRLRTALTRVERGEYGLCEECGGEIGHLRLAALPDVATCLGCQERLERSLAQSVLATHCGVGNGTRPPKAAGARPRRRRGRAP